MMRNKYMFAAIFLLASFKYSAGVASIPDLNKEGDFRYQSKPTMKLLPANCPSIDLSKEKKPSKDEKLRKIIQETVINFKELGPIRFFPINDEMKSKTIDELFIDGH